MTQIPEELIEQMAEADCKMLWSNFRILDPPKTDMEKVKNGVDLKFDIRIIIRGRYEEFPRTKEVRVLGYGKVNLYAFEDEIEKREDIMRRFIYDNYNKDVTIGREEDE